jgi:hypothetical protein
MYESFLSVTTPATNRRLLTVAQMRAAVGVTEGSQDDKLDELNIQVSDLITKACRIEGDGVNPPTLLSETITETWRRNSYWAGGAWPFADSERQRHSLILSRFPVSSVSAVVADGTTLTADGYELRAKDGMLVRLSNDNETAWLNWKIVVVYQAGWAYVPPDLAKIASQLVQILWWQDGRDPNQKIEWTQDVSKNEWFANPHTGDLVPASLMGALQAGGFVNQFTG